MKNEVDPTTIQKIWQVVKRIIEIIVAVICGNEITTFLP